MSAPLSTTAQKNVELIAKVEFEMLGQRTQLDVIADGVARFFGTFRFIIAHSIFIAVWFALNAGLLPIVTPFDPYPYPFLALIVGIEFIFLTTFVLMNQSYNSRRQERWSHLNLQLAMLTEQEVTKNMQMLHQICSHLELKHLGGDGEVKEMKQATHVTRLAEEVAQKLGVDTHNPAPVAAEA